MIWLVGKNGMLGSELARQLEAAGLDFAGTDREVDITSRQDLEDFAAALVRSRAIPPPSLAASACAQSSGR